MKVPSLKTARHRRFLQTLVGGKTSIYQLRKLVGAMNVPQIAYELRGLNWEICTERVSMKDRDGKICRPGNYFLTENTKLLAEEALKKYVTQASPNAKVTTGKNLNKPNHTKGGA